MAKFSKKSKILAIILMLLSSWILAYYIGYKSKVLKPINSIIVDFDDNSDQSSYGAAVSLFYLYAKENKGILNFHQYFDSLSYFRDCLVYFDVRDTNYLVLYKARKGFIGYDCWESQGFFGFTKNKFYWFQPKEIVLKNFPVEVLKRSEYD